MSAELPARVQPDPDAQVADFPWGPAGTAISAINDAVSTLTTQLEQRATLLPTIVDWSGSFRDEFDTAYAQVTGTGSGVKETLQTLASSIVSGAEEANSAQSIYNNEAIRRREAEQAAQQPTGP